MWIAVDHQLAKLGPGRVRSDRDLGALGDQTCENVWIGHGVQALSLWEWWCAGYARVSFCVSCRSLW